jgi:uncharacterized membrane protein
MSRTTKKQNDKKSIEARDTMNFGNFITSNTGLIHFIASIIALLLGTLVLFSPKGTSNHKVTGRLYGLTMLVVLTTAFMTYRLFGTWGIFHWTAVISSLTLFCGLIPILTRRPSNNYVSLHFCFM